MRRLAHPVAGDLDVAEEVIDLADVGDRHLVTWLAADETTATRLATITGPPRLRLLEDS